MALSSGSGTSTGPSQPSILWPSFQSGPNMAEKGFEAALKRMNTKLHLFRPNNQNNVAVYSDLDNWPVAPLLG